MLRTRYTVHAIYRGTDLVSCGQTEFIPDVRDSVNYDRHDSQVANDRYFYIPEYIEYSCISRYIFGINFKTVKNCINLF